MIMGTSLYDLSVASYLQTVGAVAGFLERGAKHYREAGFDPDDLSGVRLYEDMARFHFQIRSVAHHSVGALEGVKSGTFQPPAAGLQPIPFADLQAMIAQTDAALRALDVDEVNSWAGKEVAFQAGDYRLPFTAENFILSFSLPNFHFHATTAYDILRMKGVPLGKRNYLGQLRLKAA
jgi:hypothetical protein